jgi:hypothetical protein
VWRCGGSNNRRCIQSLSHYCHPLSGSVCPPHRWRAVSSCRHPPRMPSHLPMAPAKRCQSAGSTCDHRHRANITRPLTSGTRGAVVADSRGGRGVVVPEGAPRPLLCHRSQKYASSIAGVGHSLVRTLDAGPIMGGKLYGEQYPTSTSTFPGLAQSAPRRPATASHRQRG